MKNAKMIDTAKTVMNVQPRLVTKKRKAPAVGTDTNSARDVLKQLVKQHKALTRSAVAVTNMASDRTNRETGEIMPCPLPADVQEAFKLLATDVAKKKAKSLESAMVTELRQIPIYREFLSKVFGVGPVVAAYLVAEIDIHRAVKSSAIRRFCGLAVINGRLERRTKGVKSGFSSEMRVRLYQAFSAMWKNGLGKGRNCKYLQIWVDAKHRKLSMATLGGKINNGVREVSAKGYAHSYGWHKAADILLEDLYTVWRTLEGLDVWPSYYAAKLGYEHGGKISVNAPTKLTLEGALELVGDVGGHPYEWPKSAVAEEIKEDAELAELH